MSDVLTKKQRSFNMSRIRSRNTTPEKSFRKLLYNKGLRGYRLNANLTGKPDIVFRKYRLAIFIDGCFWHKCPKCFVEPETRKKFWLEKIESNIIRDRKVNKKLKKDGWQVVRLWEHEINKTPEKCFTKISNIILKPDHAKKQKN